MSISDQEIIRHCLALSFVPGVGPQTVRKLLACFGSLEGVLKASYADLLRVPGVGESTAAALVKSKPYHLADRELQFAQRYGISLYCSLLEEYPPRLKHCEDAPILLYYSSRSPFPFEQAKWISIVGTRRATPYGKEFVRKFLTELRDAGHAPVVVSGLAFGIDAEAHRAALDLGLTTIAVLGHGMANLYPAQHKELARRIRTQGGLLTEYPTTMLGEKSTFIQRNRIIAGLCEATIVVESGVKGGAMATARMAFEYNREVFALPGPISRETSAGCHALIKQNRAALLESAADLIQALNWDVAHVQEAKQAALFYVPTPDEQQLIDAVAQAAPIAFDELARIVRFPLNQLNAMLLNLEFQGLIRQLPGRHYEVTR